MYKQILDYLSKDIYPFHMPGHKRNPAFIPPNLLDLDLTEIPGMDVLSAPTGIIRNLQDEIAKFYGADHSFLLVNGSSAGLIAAICASCVDGAPLVVPRNAHTSVYNAMAMSGAVPHYIMPEMTSDGLAGGISPSAFDDMPWGAAALVVSPTYEGFVSDIAAIAEKVHSRGGILIVDEAHGAHFAFHGAFPSSALSLGADIVVHSLHKTLPAPSQCALLHVKGTYPEGGVCQRQRAAWPVSEANDEGRRIDINRAKFLINAVQTSSPSYILMSVCDFMLRLLWRQPNFFEDYLHRLEKMKVLLPCEKSFAAMRLSGRERVGKNSIFDIDPGKLLFSVYLDTAAEDIAQMMAHDYKVQMEMAAGRHILAMTSVADTDEGFDRLKAAVSGVNARYASSICQFSNVSTPSYIIPEVVIPPRNAMAMPSKEISWEDAVGQISAQLIAKYPPGIALIAPGERILPGIPKQSETIRVIKYC